METGDSAATRAVDPGVTTERYREEMWALLRQVARPDSRFHWDFSSFIADFEGSDRCAEQIMALDTIRPSGGTGERRIFITPDNCLEDLRAALLRSGRGFVMTTYGITRGFFTLDAADVPKGEERFAATLDGFERFARPISLAELAVGTMFGVCVTGASALSSNGVRFGKGHGYFDFEFAVLSDLGLTDADTSVIGVVHDCQYVDTELRPQAHDVSVDLIVTPTRTMPIEAQEPRPRAYVRWDLLAGTEFERLSVVAELRAMHPDSA